MVSAGLEGSVKIGDLEQREWHHSHAATAIGTRHDNVRFPLGGLHSLLGDWVEAVLLVCFATLSRWPSQSSRNHVANEC